MSDEAFDVLMAASSVAEAKIAVLQSVVWLLLEKTGDDNINGISFADWFEIEYRKRLQETLIRIEDKSSAYAAKLQAIIDESDRRTRGTNSGDSN